MLGSPGPGGWFFAGPILLWEELADLDTPLAEQVACCC